PRRVATQVAVAAHRHSGRVRRRAVERVGLWDTGWIRPRCVAGAGVWARRRARFWHWCRCPLRASAAAWEYCGGRDPRLVVAAGTAVVGDNARRWSGDRTHLRPGDTTGLRTGGGAGSGHGGRIVPRPDWWRD